MLGLFCFVTRQVRQVKRTFLTFFSVPNCFGCLSVLLSYTRGSNLSYKTDKTVETGVSNFLLYACARLKVGNICLICLNLS